MRHRVNNQLPNNLPQLQNLIKRDSVSYRDEFLQQLRHFESLIEVFQLQPHQKNEELQSLAMFLAQVSHCYKEDLESLPNLLIDVLRKHRTVLNPELRLGFCKTLILLRSKNVVPALPVFELFFVLFRCQDKSLRKFLHDNIISDVKNMNKTHKDMKLNTSLQNFMFNMLKDSHPMAAKMALDILMDLYKKNVWRNPKVVNVICTACLSKVTKIMVAALNFFLGADQPDSDGEEEESESDEEPISAREVIMANRVNKKSRKRKKQLEKVKQAIKKKKQKNKAPQFNFSAIHLIHDPQSFSEKLYAHLEKLHERFEVKVMMMQVISRLIGIQELIVLNFYPFLQRYLQPHQREVIKILACCAQASHPLVPPDVLESVIRTIADNFITERNAAEVMAVGINAVREICARAPLSISEDLLQDLTQYKKHKDRGVNMAAKSLIQLYRSTQHHMLHKKDRGQPTEAQSEVHNMAYGQLDAPSHVPGAEVLLNNKEESTEKEESEEEEEGSDDSEWENVTQDSEEEEDDGDDDEEKEEDQDDNSKQLSKIDIAEQMTFSRILTQEDFKKIEAAQIAKQTTKATPRAKRKLEALKMQEPKELVKQADIEMVFSKKRHDKLSRLASVMEGRKDRPGFGRKLNRLNPHASTSNKEKGKKKNFMMLKRKISNKYKTSFKDKQRRYRNAVQKQRRKLLIK